MRLTREEAFAIRYHMGFSGDENKNNISNAMEIRITSYNVCYTKLLRYELNKALQGVLNPYSKNSNELKTQAYTFRENDKVMQTKNNYDINWTRDDERGSGIFNGDIGIVKSVDKTAATLTIDFDGRLCVYNSAMQENLELAYAITVHKSQGSEFDVVILPLLGGFRELVEEKLNVKCNVADEPLLCVAKGTRLSFQLAEKLSRITSYNVCYTKLLRRRNQENCFIHQ